MDRAPMIAMNSVSLSPKESVKSAIIEHRIVLLRFLHHYLLADLGQPLYRCFSMVVWAG